jgi:hypothetical protein
MPESETDHILELRHILEARRDAEMGPRCMSFGPQTTTNLASVGRYEVKLNSANFAIAVRRLDRAVVDFRAPRGSCEMMVAVVKTLEPREDRRGIKPVELGTRLAAGADHLRSSACRKNWSTILPCSGESESLRHFQSFVLEIWSTCKANRQLKTPPENSTARPRQRVFFDDFKTRL